MLSNENIRRINSQITDELREATRFVNSDEEKAAALDRAERLKKLLDPNPSPDQLIQMLVTALSSQPTPAPQVAPSNIDVLVDAIRAFRR